MKPGLHELYSRLSDGRLHNGAELAGELGITRAAVWKRMQGLRKLGLEITGTAGDGYRLPHPVELLDADAIRAQLDHDELELEVVGAVDSTNTQLSAAGTPHGRVLIAEAQTAGRGRRGRHWLSPPGSGLYLSLAWRFESGLAGLSLLSLVVGLSAAQTLEQLSCAAVKVKWPNDLFVGHAKLGGCLVDLGGAAEGPCRAVVGVGINLSHTPSLNALDQTSTVLEEHAHKPVGRNALAAGLINALAKALARFDERGVDELMAHWPQFDLLHNKPVTVSRADGHSLSGTARGIDRQGRLLVESGNRTQPIASGEVSVRAA